MSNNKSLFKMSVDGKLTKPVTVFIEKMSDAIGTCYHPIQMKREARAQVEVDKILATGELEVTEIQKRGLQRLIHQEERKQQNIENITKSALEYLPEHAKPEYLDSDWIAYFFEKCANISDKDMQSLWAKILTGEATQSGSFSKRTIQFVSTIDKKDAEMFTKLNQLSFYIDDGYTLLIYNYDDSSRYAKCDMTFNFFHHLESIGLIKYLENANYYCALPTTEEFIYYFDNKFKIKLTESKTSICTGVILLTPLGEELAKISGAQPNEEFMEYAIKKIAEQENVISIEKISSR